MDRQNLDKILSAVKDLPTIPVVVAQLMTTLNDEKSDAKKVSEIIKNDQSITMKILRLVNSAYFGLSNRVTSVNQAVPLLGFDKIKNIIFTLTVFDALKNQKGIFEFGQVHHIEY
nr:HDOD domain-containing protein [bacterium]